MITILLNDETVHVSATNVNELISEIKAEAGTFAIALNQEFIPRSDYTTTSVQDGDKLEFLSPMQGG